MHKQVLIVYKSVTGFTRQYTEWIAEELGCETKELKDTSAQEMSEYDTIIFGGRFHAGAVDGLKKAKELFAKSGAHRLIVFSTGASPDTLTETIEEAWKNNFTQEELVRIPHFYMPGGLCYEKMPLGDKLMMKVFAAMMRRKKDKSEYEKEMAQALGRSYDFSSREYIKPLVSYIVSQC